MLKSKAKILYGVVIALLERRNTRIDYWEIDGVLPFRRGFEKRRAHGQNGSNATSPCSFAGSCGHAQQ